LEAEVVHVKDNGLRGLSSVRNEPRSKVKSYRKSDHHIQQQSSQHDGLVHHESLSHISIQNTKT
jgi:hypothetical protein